MIAEVFASKSPAFTISTRVTPICRLVLSDTPSPLSRPNDPALRSAHAEENAYSRWPKSRGESAEARMFALVLLLQRATASLADFPIAPLTITAHQPLFDERVPRPLRRVAPAREIGVRRERLKVHITKDALHALTHAFQDLAHLC